MLPDKPWGWRGRVGLIMPTTQTLTEPLFYAVAPEGISFHTTRLQMAGSSVSEILASMDALVPRAIAELAQARVNCITHLCVSGGLLRGRDREEQFCTEVEQNTGIPVVSALFAVTEAFNILKVKKILVADPYVKDVQEQEKKFLEDCGFQVVGMHGLGLTDPFEIDQVPPHDIYAFCKKSWDKSAEGLFISCCAFNGMPVAEKLERELEVPVVTAHSAVLWQILKKLGIKEPVPGFGKLLSQHL